MKKIIQTLLLVMLSVIGSTSLIYFVLMPMAIREIEPQEKAVPIYQGMEVIQDSAAPLSLIRTQFPFTFDSEVDTNTFEPDFDVIEEEGIQSYVELNETFFVSVKLANPDNFVILSFTLNGVFYQSFQFEDGSDSETLILEVTAGDVAGLKEYTIDAIKYIDGTEIKDVVMQGDKTIKVGVRHEVAVTAETTIVTKDLTSASIEVDVNDPNNLTAQSEGLILGYLVQGDTVLNQYTLNVGLNTVNFDALDSSQNYNFYIVTVYDLFDGEGPQVRILDELAIETHRIVKLEVESLTSNQMVLFPSYYEGASATLNNVELYFNNELVATYDETFTFSELRSNTTYTLKTYYTFDLNDGNGEQQGVLTQFIKTLAKTPGSLSYASIDATKEGATINFNLDDTDNTIQVLSFEIFKNGILDEVIENPESFVLEGLLSGQEYTVITNYHIDLNDGLTPLEYQLTASFNTPAKIAPEVNIALTRTATTISYLPLGDDPDNILIIKEARLYDNQNILEQTILEGEEPTFTDLIPNKAYIVELVYEYDLNDGQNVVSETVRKDITTAKATPEAIIDIVDVLIDRVFFDIYLYDPNNSAAFEWIRLYRGATLLVETSNPSIREFEDLSPATQYTIQTVIRYDLDDGTGSRTTIVDFNFSTAKEVPEFGIESFYSTKDSIHFTFFEEDIHDAGTITSIELIDENNEAVSLEDTSLRTFNGLLSDHNYTLLVRYEVDVNDGNGPQERTFTQDIKTQAKELPAINPGFTFTKTSITYDLEIIDTDGVGFVTQVDLALNGEVVVSDLDLVTQTIDNLLSNTAYELWVTLEYDMNDGLGTQEGTVELSATTMAKVTPVIDFSRLQPFAKSIEYRVSVSDPDQVGSIEGIYLYDGETLVETLTAINGIFETLNPDSNYTIKVVYTYDLNDGNGPLQLDVSRDTYTTPYIAVFETNVINTEKVTEGDTVVIELTIDNPSKINFTQATINGQTFDVSNISTTSFIRVEIVIDDTYEGGLNTFTVEELIGSRSGDIKLFELNGNNFDTAFVNGDINALELRIVDENDNDLESGMPGDDFFIEITFDNGSLYDIETVSLSYVGTLNKSQFIQSEDKQTIRIPQTLYYSNTMIDFNLREFTYSSIELGLKSKNANVNDFLIAVVDSTYREISTVQEFIAMQNGYAYKLTNDIDLDGIQWVPKDLNYIDLDGNGYSILNLRTVKTFNDTNIYFGLFRTLNFSTVKNLNIERSLTILTLNSAGQSYEGYGGLIAANAYYTSFVNVSVSGEMSISNATSGRTYIGGFVGSGDQITIKDSTASVLISSKTIAGGFVARGWNIKIERSYTTGELFTEERVGGFIGESGGVSILDSYSTMSINSNNYSGVSGLLGNGYDNINIRNSYFNGQIITQNRWSKAGLISEGSGATIVNSFSTGTITNNVSKDDPEYYNENLPAVWDLWGEFNINQVYDLVSNRGELGINDYASFLPLEEIITTMSAIWNNDTWSFGGEYPVLKTRPSVRFNNVSAGETTISFDIVLGDFEGESSIASIELISNGEVVQTLEDTTVRRFDNLRYNTQYLIRVTYNYDYLDDAGVQQIVSTYAVRTLPVEGVPEVFIQNVETSYDGVTFDILLEDPRDVASISAIRLYDENEVLVEALSDLTLRTFTGLDSNSNYRIEVEVTYDLEDNYGPQIVTDTKYIRTSPAMTLTETGVLGGLTSGILLGDRVVLKLDIVNEDEVVFSEVVINGVTYEVQSSSNTAVLVYVTIDDAFEVGDATLTVESMTGRLLGNDYTYTFNENNTFDFYVNGNINVLDVRVVDENGQVLDYQLNGQQYTVEVEFNNPTGYTIESVMLKNTPWDNNGEVITNFEVNDDNTVISFNRTYSGWYSQYVAYVGISEFNYSNEMITDRKQRVTNQYTTFTFVQSMEVREIDSTDDMLDIEPGYVYELVNDIDMIGIDWTPIADFYGVFEGNNYTISNLNIVGDFVGDNNSNSIGLFRNVVGAIIRNVHFKDANVIVSVSESNDSYTAYHIGVLAGRIEQYSQVSNVSVAGGISVTSSYKGNVGGVVGYANEMNFDRIASEISISAGGRVGGLIGESYNISITNSYANVSLQHKEESYIGGLVGYLGNSRISNAYATGKITIPDTLDNPWGYGSISGNAWSNTFESVFSYVLREDNVTKVRSFNDNSNVVKNSYSTMTETNFEQMTLVDILSALSDVWSVDVWNFASDYPTLKQAPIVSLQAKNIVEYGFSFDIDLIDIDNVAELSAVKLYLNDELYRELDDLSVLTFDNIKYATTYKLVVTHAYNYGDSDTDTLVDTVLIVRTADKENVPEILFAEDNFVIDSESVTFDFDVLDPASVGTGNVVVTLHDYQTFEILQTATDGNYMFDNLLSGNQYKIQVRYEYDFNDNFGINEEVEVYEFMTLNKQMPSVELPWENRIEGDDFYTFGWRFNDPNEIAEIVKIELIFNGEVVQTLNEDIPSNITFNNLYSNQSWDRYYILFTYTYDLNNGSGLQQTTSMYGFTTQAKQAPTVQFEYLEIDQDSLNFSATLNDPDMIGEIAKVEVVSEENVIFTSTEVTQGLLEDLVPNTEYELRISYKYNLNDLTAVKTNVYSYTFTTAPGFDVTGFSIINDISELVYNQVMILSIDIDNPNNMIFESVVINGLRFDVKSQTSENLKVDVIVTDALGVEDVTLVLQKVQGVLDSATYTYNIEVNNTADIYINGEVSVSSVNVLDEDGVSINQANYNDTIFIDVYFDNETNYDINSITVNRNNVGELVFNASDFVFNNNNTHIRLRTTVSALTMNAISVTNFSYSNQNLADDQSLSNMRDSFVVLADEEIVYISSAIDLQNMTERKHYVLTQDLDLDGFDWVPYEFVGLFDGQNFTVSNLRIFETVTEGNDHYFGLFTIINGGSVSNLQFKDTYVYITYNSENYGSVYAGALSGRINNYANVSNVSIEADVSISNSTNNVNTYAGLLTGYAYYATLERIATSGSVDARSYVGGIVGVMQQSQLTYAYSTANFTITSNYGGGIVGQTDNSQFNYVYSRSVYTSNEYRSVGGIAGYNSYSTFNHVFNQSKRLVNNEYLRAFNYSNHNNNITWKSAVYAVSNGTTYIDEPYFTRISEADLLTYLNENWSLDIWNITSIYPTLKNSPTLSIQLESATIDTITFDLNLIDLNDVATIESIELYDGDTLVDTLSDLTLRVFENVRYSYEYQLKVTYSYDYGDSAGTITKVETLDIKTADKEGVPSVSITNLVPKDTTVTFDLTETDTLNIGDITSITLSDSEGNIVDSLDDLSLRTFTGLTENTSYTLVVTMTYDFNDDYGPSEVYFRQSFKTVPEFNLLGFNILTTGTIKVGDLMTVSLDIENPNNVVFTSATINGHEIEVSSQNESTIRIEFTLDERFPYGQTTLELEGLKGTLSGQTFNFLFGEDNSEDTFINGTISITNIIPKDSNGNDIEYVLRNESFDIYVYFDNDTGYEVTSIQMNGTTYTLSNNQYTLHDNNTLAKITVTAGSSAYQTFSINEFYYDNDRIDPTRRLVVNTFTSVNILIDDTLIDVSTVAELQAMTSGYAYRLVNDIDLKDVNWTPINQFSGYFDGNGFKITNFTVVSTFVDESVSIGLFSSLDGAIIKNLVIDNVFISVNMTSEVNQQYSSYVGILTPRLNYYNYITNVHVSGEIIVRNNTNGQVYIGGLVSRAYSYNTLTDVSFTGDITNDSTQNSPRIGGLVGYLERSVIKSSFTDVKIISEGNYIGGLVGNTQSNSILENVYSIVIFEGNQDWINGGLVGRLNNSTVKNAYAMGSSNQYIGTIGYADNGSRVENVYGAIRYNNAFTQTIRYFSDSRANITNVFTLQQDGYSQFQTLAVILQRMEQLFDSTIWDFENTLEGGHPTLK